MDYQPIDSLVDEIKGTTGFLSHLIFNRVMLTALAVITGIFIVISVIF